MSKKNFRAVFGLTSTLVMGYIGFNSIVYAEEVEEPTFVEETETSSAVETEQPVEQPTTVVIEEQPVLVSEEAEIQEPVLAVAEVKTVSNVTKFVDESGNEIAPSQPGTVGAIAINGYVHKGTQTREDSDGNVETTYVYRVATPADAPVENVTFFLDESGNTLSAKQAGTVDAIRIEGYVHKSTATRTDKAGNVETTHVYAVATTANTVPHVTYFLDESGNTISKQQAGTVKAIKINGYVHKSTSVREDSLGNVETTHVYRLADETEVVRNVTLFVDESGKQIAPEQVGTVEPIIIDGYVVKSTGTRKDDFGNVETTHTYVVATEENTVRNITLFVDEEGKSVADSQDGKKDAINIDGYVNVSSSTRTDSLGNVETTHVYKKIPAEDLVANVTHFVDENGKTIAADQAGTVGPIEIAGYEVVKTGTHSDGYGHTETTHTYRKTTQQTTKSVTHFVNEAGEKIAADANGVVDAISIAGYTHKATKTETDGYGNTETTHTYQESVAQQQVPNITHFVNEAGETISPDQPGFVNPIEIAGYELSKTSSKSDDKGNTETTYTYRVKQKPQDQVRNVTHFVDEQGKTIAEDQGGTVEAIEIEGYVHTSTSTSTDQNGNTETTHTYRVATEADAPVANVTHFVDESGKSIAQDQNGKVAAINIDGYTHVSTSRRSDDKGNEETTHVYKVKETSQQDQVRNVTHFVDEEGKTLAADQEGNVDAIEIAGYVHKGTKRSSDGNGNVEVTHTYRVATEADAPVANVTHFVDEAGKSIAPDQNGKVSAINIEGYTQVRTSTRSDDKGNVETTHVYKVKETSQQDQVRNVTHFVDEEGKTLAADQDGNVDAIEIAGYVHKGTRTAESSDGTKELTHIYRVATEADAPVANVTHFVDEAGKTIAQDQNGKVAAINIEGYTHISTSRRSDDKGNVETTHIYKVKEASQQDQVRNVTHFVDEQGKTLAADQDGNVAAIEIAGYVHKGTKRSSDSNGNVEVTHTYRVATEADAPVANVTHFVDEAGKTIANDKAGTVNPIQISGYVVVSTSSRSDDKGNVETTHTYRVATEADAPVANVTHFVDEAGKTIANDKAGKVDAIEITGYVHKSTKRSEDGNGNVETTHIYRVATEADAPVANVTHFVDESGKSIAEDRTGTVNPIQISGYTVISSSSRSDSKGNVETTHVYKANQASQQNDNTVRNVTLFVDEQGKTLAPEKAGTVDAIVIDGYVKKGVSTRTDSDGNVETTYVYRLATADDYVNNETLFVDEAGKTIAAKKSGTVKPISIAGYVHKSTKTRTDDKGNVETTHTYRLATADDEVVANVTHFVDENGKTIAQDQSGQVSPITISGYVHIATGRKTKDGNVETTHTYRKATQNDVVVANVTHFVDEDGKTLSKDQNGQVQPIKINGYVVAQTKTAKDENGNVETTHIYTKATSENTVRNVTQFVDESGKVIAAERSGKVNPIDIDGYVFVKTSTSKDSLGNVQTTHIYKVGNAVKNVTHFVDEQGNKIASDKNGEASAQWIDGYVHVKTGWKKDGLGHKEITHTYKKETRRGVVELNGTKVYLGKDGKIDKNFNLAATYSADGKNYQFKNGKLDTSVTGLVKHENGSQVYVEKGVGSRYTGVVKKASDGKWYFVRNGVAEKFTGLSKSIQNGKWYYTKDGVLDWNFTGMAKSVQNGKLYFVRKGALDWDYTGIAKSVHDGKWYFARKGEFDNSFTGVAKSIANDKYYFVRGGVLDWNFTGVAKSVTNGKYYFVRKGELDWSFTGIAASADNGKYYFVRNGALDWSYTGGAKLITNGKWYAIQKGALSYTYNGKLKCTDNVTRKFSNGAAL